MVAKPTRRLFTVREYYKMDKVGILKPDERTELIEGVIIKMPSIGVPHASQVNRVLYVFMHAVEDQAELIIQNAIHLNQRSEPQPDVMLVRPKADFYASGHPTPGDAFLVVEVRDPGPRGYAVTFSVRRGDRIAPIGLPDIAFAVDVAMDDLLGPPTIVPPP